MGGRRRQPGGAKGDRHEQRAARRLAASAAMVPLLAATLAGCGATGPLEVDGEAAELCAVAGADGTAVIVVDGLNNTLDRPVQVIWVDLIEAVDLTPVELGVDGLYLDPGRQTLEFAVDLYAPSPEGWARGIRIAYTDGTEPETVNVDVSTDVRVLPAGGDCSAPSDR